MDGLNMKKECLIMLERILTEKYARWDNVLHNGYCDPCNADGLILMKIREDIIRCRQEIEYHYPREVRPAVYYLEVPPVVQATYMARSDEIRRNAKKTFWILKHNKSYLYLQKNMRKLTAEELESEKEIQRIIKNLLALREAFERDDLLTLRKNENPTQMLKFQMDAANRLKILLARKKY